jgi:hypothetical protein
MMENVVRLRKHIASVVASCVQCNCMRVYANMQRDGVPASRIGSSHGAG